MPRTYQGPKNSSRGYRRFVQMYSDVVLGIELHHFEKHLERAKAKRGVKQDIMTFTSGSRVVFRSHMSR